ncbi:TIM-barrel domain-containing protein [Segetibacter sp. 3557_3]|uniref:glycoside hydrolase family 31 protein n=1 Tax=Segetibacter sp. 3557_3 TaxID=2547429 RepID=UPI001405530E|nr:TIM-barrel domain-containing protein [Segetibacter sp. 3557_3]
MKKSYRLKLPFTILGLVLLSCGIGNVDAQRQITVAGQPVQLSLTSVSPNTVRFTLLPLNAAKQPEPLTTDLVIEDRWQTPDVKTTQLSAARQFKLQNISVTFSPSPLKLSFFKRGKLFQQFAIDTANGNVHFTSGNGPLYGLGSGGQRYDRRGTYDEMQEGVPANESQIYGSRIPIPLLINPVEKWSLFFHLPYKAAFDLRTGTTGHFIPRPSPALPTEKALPLDVFISYNDSTPAIMQHYTRLTGKAPMPPKWALGYMQSHRTLESPDSILQEAKTFRDKKIPADVMIYLGTGYAPTGWNMGHANMDFNPKTFDKPDQMIKQLQEQHFKVILHVNNTPRTLHGVMAPSATDTGRDYAFNYWRWHQPVNKKIDGWWPDDGDELPIASRLTRHMIYREGQLMDKPNLRPFALHRTGYAGMHRYGSWNWSGDCFSLWSTLDAHVQLGLNAGLGVSPYWGSDIGGFVATREFTGELYTRWFQFATFSPLFRSHGRQWKLHHPWGWSNRAIGPNEVSLSPGAGLDTTQLYNPQVEPICKKFLELRYQLLPYNYTAARENYDKSLPLMRPLWMHYPDDSVALRIRSQYLWGRNFLVAPVTEKGRTMKEVYLPEGAWYDFWSNRKYQGNQWISRYVELSTMPLYVVAGSIIPMDPVRQYVDEPTTDTATLRVYAGANGTYELYEDDGNTLDYEKLPGSTIHFAWNDQTRLLTIEPANTRGQKINRAFNVQLIAGQRQNTPTRWVEYKGEKMEVKL